MKKKRLFNSKAEQSIPLKDIPIMVSGCPLGICCRYDDSQSASHDDIHFASSANVIPFSPEQLGVLHTPRHPALFRRSEINPFDINPKEFYPPPDFLKLLREIS
jgi:hypothetical protein